MTFFNVPVFESNHTDRVTGEGRTTTRAQHSFGGMDAICLRLAWLHNIHEHKSPLSHGGVRGDLEGGRVVMGSRRWEECFRAEVGRQGPGWREVMGVRVVRIMSRCVVTGWQMCSRES